jgi:hypothetical protein
MALLIGDCGAEDSDNIVALSALSSSSCCCFFELGVLCVVMFYHFNHSQLRDLHSTSSHVYISRATIPSHKRIEEQVSHDRENRHQRTYI